MQAAMTPKQQEQDMDTDLLKSLAVAVGEVLLDTLRK
jgi:hypothetical protein